VLYGYVDLEGDSPVRAFVPDDSPEPIPRLLSEYDRADHGIARAVLDIEAYFAAQE